MIKHQNKDSILHC